MNDSQQQGVPAVGFLVMAFLDETATDQTLDAMKQAKKQGQFYLEDPHGYPARCPGKERYRAGELSAPAKARASARWSAALRASWAARLALHWAQGSGQPSARLLPGDKGFRNESLGTVGVALKPGTSAIAAITSHDFLRAVQKRVHRTDSRSREQFGRRTLEQLGENKNVAIGLLLTENGLAIKEIAANEEVAEVMGAVITNDATIVGAAVATADGVAYQVVGATKEGVTAEVGVITAEGAVIVDAVALAEVPTIDAGVRRPMPRKNRQRRLRLLRGRGGSRRSSEVRRSLPDTAYRHEGVLLHGQGF